MKNFYNRVYSLAVYNFHLYLFIFPQGMIITSLLTTSLKTESSRVVSSKGQKYYMRGSHRVSISGKESNNVSCYSLFSLEIFLISWKYIYIF